MMMRLAHGPGVVPALVCFCFENYNMFMLNWAVTHSYSEAQLSVSDSCTPLLQLELCRFFMTTLTHCRGYFSNKGAKCFNEYVMPRELHNLNLQMQWLTWWLGLPDRYAEPVSCDWVTWADIADL
ncbi:unnamed protein product [Amoebophrya sp. A120]|nr:unnamed protein product [Amoebophrya sp. A120]|eukprot:GSA120T00013194001.1